MLKGSLSPYPDTHNEEESYVTLSNGPHGKRGDISPYMHDTMIITSMILVPQINYLVNSSFLLVMQPI